MESYLNPPQQIGPPGDTYLRNQRAFQGIPGIERSASGRLWAAWYGGGKTEDRHNRILLTTSADSGNSWSDITLTIDPDGEGPVRAFDPCLWHDPNGRLWLFWAQGYEKQADERSGVWAITTHESDVENPTWTRPQRLCDGIMMNKPTLLSSGEWLLPVARWHRAGSAGVFGSADEGKTWSEFGRANVPEKADRNCDEHMLVERRNHSLWMWVRTRYGIGHSISTDRGRTWTPVVPSKLQHPASRFFIRRLHSGNLLLVKHGPLDKRTERSHLTAYLSEDDGQTWTGGLLLDERVGVSYPDGVQAPDGMLYIIYDRERTGAREILLARFTEEEILRGPSPNTTLRLPVNQAG